MAGPEDHRKPLPSSIVTDVLQGRDLQAVFDQSQGYQGYGYALWVGSEETPIRVIVYPYTKTVDIHSSLAALRLSQVQSIARRGNELHITAENEHEEISVAVTPNGDYKLRRRPVTGQSAAPDLITELALGPAVEQIVPRAAVTATPTEAAPQETTPRTEQDRVTIRGRIGRAPRFRTTKQQNTLVANFPLGEHVDLERTVWHSIVVFGDRARKLQEKGLSVGQEIEIVGYPHERIVESQTGSKTVTEIYATAIRTTLMKPQEKP